MQFRAIVSDIKRTSRRFPRSPRHLVRKLRGRNAERFREHRQFVEEDPAVPRLPAIDDAALPIHPTSEFGPIDAEAFAEFLDRAADEVRTCCSCGQDRVLFAFQIASTVIPKYFAIASAATTDVSAPCSAFQ